MPEPVSAIALIAFTGLTSLRPARFSSAVSKESFEIRRTVQVIGEAEESSVSLFGDKSVALSELAALFEECSEDGWDGGQADAISEAARSNVKAFITALPWEMEMPELAAEPDGSVSLEWDGGFRRLFSVSINGGTRMAYAGIDGTDRWRGVARFDGDNVPQIILESISRVVA